MTAFLLLLSIILSTGRNLLSKNLSSVAFGTATFFRRQGILFAFGMLALLIFGAPAWKMPSVQTLIYAGIYGALLIFAQWFYTIALGAGNTALCSTVYSMGFILPTLSGALLWSEPFSPLDLVGVLCAVAAILASKGAPQEGSRGTGHRYFLPLLVSMLASGGLGIMQKVQQRSTVANERGAFLILAFLFAAVISFLAAIPTRERSTEAPIARAFWVASGVGIAFGSCNLLNTALAGRLPGAVFFPTLNIGVILCTMLCGLLIFRERIRRREILVLIFGGLSILLLNIG